MVSAPGDFPTYSRMQAWVMMQPASPSFVLDTLAPGRAMFSSPAMNYIVVAYKVVHIVKIGVPGRGCLQLSSKYRINYIHPLLYRLPDVRAIAVDDTYPANWSVSRRYLGN